MAKSRHRSMTIVPPLAGTHRRTTYQQQPPFTAYDSRNVWPIDWQEERRRVGVRPGADSMDTSLAPLVGGPVRLLTQLNVADGKTTGYILLAAVGGNLYRWKTGETAWTMVVSTATLTTSEPIASTAFGNKLYIADHGVDAEGIDLQITPGSPATVQSATVPDWSVAGVTTDHALHVRSGDNKGLYNIASISGGTLTLAENITAGDLTNLHFAVTRKAKVYDATADTLEVWEADQGQIPHGSKVIATWQDRIVLGNDGVSPHVWYMARSGDPQDWLYGQSSLGSPVAGNTFHAGLIGEPVTAIMSHNRECLLIGSENSLWVIRGDPLGGGYIERLSHVVGPVGPFAWTKTAEDETLFITKDGLYWMPPGCGDTPRSVSRERIPQELLGLHDPDRDVYVEYDLRYRGLHITTEISDTVGQYWWFDMEEKGFWRLDYDPASRPVNVTNFWAAYSETKSPVIFAGADGRIRQLKQGATGDGSVSIVSYLIIGPIKVGSTLHDNSIISEFVARLAVTGSNVKITLFTAEDAETVIGQAPTRTRRYVIDSLDPDNDVFYKNPRINGHAAIIRLDSSGPIWALEECNMIILTRSGRIRS